MERDNRIYGLDENDFAEGIAGDALKPGGTEDVWGARVDQKATAKGNDPDNENPDAKVIGGMGGAAKKSEGN